MMSQPEKIFRGKLENYQRAAPPAAWGRIEHNLNAKAPNLIWFKIAAGVLVLFIAGYIFWTNQLVQPLPAVAVSQEPVQKRPEITNPGIVDEIITPKENIIETTTTVKKDPKKSSPQIVQENKPVVVEKALTPKEDLVASNQVDTRIVETGLKEPMIVHKSTVITYSADEVNSRFLRRKHEPEVIRQESSTGLKKISDVAISIKNNERGIGDLRQMKDEILTLDFLASNDKRQKK